MAEVVKTSVSIDPVIWSHLRKEKNKSYIINKALAFFYDKEKFIVKAEKEYWNTVLHSLEKGNGEYLSINQNNTKVTQSKLDETLWK